MARPLPYRADGSNQISPKDLCGMGWLWIVYRSVISIATRHAGTCSLEIAEEPHLLPLLNTLICSNKILVTKL